MITLWNKTCSDNFRTGFATLLGKDSSEILLLPWEFNRKSGHKHVILTKDQLCLPCLALFRIYSHYKSYAMRVIWVITCLQTMSAAVVIISILKTVFQTMERKVKFVVYPFFQFIRQVTAGLELTTMYFIIEHENIYPARMQVIMNFVCVCVTIIGG